MEIETSARTLGGAPAPLPRMNRRRFLAASTASALLVATGGTLASCAAAADGGGAAASAFDPTVGDWLTTIASTIGATIIEDALTKGLSGFFSSWTSNVSDTVSKQSPPLYSSDFWVHQVPPVVLIGMYQTEQGDPSTDQLLACVNNGSDAVVFEPWAWQALSYFLNDLTSGLTGAQLREIQALCVLSVIPSGTVPQSGSSPEGSVAWMTYTTHNGTVEISEQKQSDGSYSATVLANGIPDANNQPTIKQYNLSNLGASTSSTVAPS